MDDSTNAAGAYFGSAIAVSGDTSVVGAPGAAGGGISSGSAYVYHLLSQTPAIPLATFSAPNPSNLFNFGSAVAIDGNRVVVGTGLGRDLAVTEYRFPSSPMVYVFDLFVRLPRSPNAFEPARLCA